MTEKNSSAQQKTQPGNGEQPPGQGSASAQDRTGPEPEAEHGSRFSVPPSPIPLEEEEKMLWESYLKDRSPFPKPMRQQAYYGIAREIVQIMSQECEACPEALLLHFLVMAGNRIGRSVYFYSGHRLFPNEFAIMVGPTGRGRKGSALDMNQALWQQLDPDWWKNCKVKNIESGEFLIDRIRDEVREPYKKKNGVLGFRVVHPGIDDKRLFGVEEEFGSFLITASRRGNNVSGIMRELWDSPDFTQTGGKKSPRQVTDAHFSFIGHITPKDLKKHLTDTELANGSANRALWCACYKARTLDEPDEIDWKRKYPDLITRLNRIFRQYKPNTDTPVRFYRSENANHWWKNQYRKLCEQKERDTFIDGIVVRDTSHLLKLALIYAVLDENHEINSTYLEAAKAVCDYAQATARWLFMERLGNRQTQKMLFGLMRHPEGLTISEIRTRICGSNVPVMDIIASLEDLAKNDVATMRLEVEAKGGRRERWFYRPWQ